ncbi:uncharacterized protein [Penaeus vannamei]|uniref:uncharacterized protein n=1 Tax=Penaeus vannamei TaxID=6689 RepID=UPI00387F7630
MKDEAGFRSSGIRVRSPHVRGSAVGRSGTTKSASRCPLLLLTLLLLPPALLTTGPEDSQERPPLGSRTRRGYEEAGERGLGGQRTTGEEPRRRDGEPRGVVSGGTSQATAATRDSEKDLRDILYHVLGQRNITLDYDADGQFGVLDRNEYHSNDNSDHNDEYSGDNGNIYDYSGDNGIYDYSGDYGDIYDYSGDDGDIYDYSGDDGDIYDYSGDYGDIYDYSGDYGDIYDYSGDDGDIYDYSGDDGDIYDYSGDDGDIYDYSGDDGDIYDYSGDNGDIYDNSYDNGSHHNYNEDTSLLLMFSRIIYLCEYVFSAIYGSYDKLPTTWVKHNNASLLVVSEPRFVAVCEPFLRRYDTCEARFPVTVCEAENVTFLHPTSCKRPSLEDVYFEKLLVVMRLEQDDPCFHAVCNGLLRVVDRVVNGVLVRLVSPDGAGEVGNTSCHRHIQELFLTPKGEPFAFRARNFQWPFCFAGYHVLWAEDPRPRGLVPLWDFLPVQCRAVEVGLSLFSLLNACFGVTGNIVVIVVRYANFSRWKYQDTIKVSLAICDLFLCLFVILPSIGDHLSLRAGRLEGPANQETSNVVIDSGFRLFSAVVATTCCITSIFQRFAFSVWILRRTQTRPDFLRVQWLRAFPVVSWAVSLMTTLLLMHDDTGSTGTWASFSKLPFGLSQISLSISFPIVMAVLALISLLTLLNYAVILWKNLATAARPGHAEGGERIGGLTNLDMADISRRRHRLALLIIQVLVIFVTSFMVGLDLTLKFREGAYFTSYVAWWLYLSGASWNPWLYNFCSKRFRQDAADVLKKIFEQIKPRGRRRKVLGVVRFWRNLGREGGGVRGEGRLRLRQEAECRTLSGCYTQEHAV